MNVITALTDTGPDAIQDMGLPSGNVDLIHAGETINFAGTPADDPGYIQHLIERAQNLTDQDRATIMSSLRNR